MDTTNVKYDLTLRSNYLNTLNLQNYSKLRYEFFFVSLLPVSIIVNLRHIDWTSPTSSFTKENYILIKQSYLILTWLSYMSSTKQVSTKSSIRFATLPIRRKKYTLIKAPMAHKTNSLEQYGFKFYHFKASFLTNLTQNKSVTSVDCGALFALHIKKLFPVFSTNLLLLKYYNITFTVSDTSFFNYPHLLKRLNSQKKL